MDEPHWQKVWRCPYCQNLITDEAMRPSSSMICGMEESSECEGDSMKCPVCSNTAWVPEE